MDSGFITLHRKILGWYGASSPYRFSLWVTMILLANHEEKQWIWKGKKYIVKRGEFITSRKTLSSITSISESYIEKLLKEFESQEMLGQQTSNVSRLITIFNYEQYQSRDNRVHSGVHNKGTSKGHPRDTNNHLTIKQIKKRGCFTPPTSEEVGIYCKERKNGLNPEMFVDFYSTKGWMVGKNKMKDWKAAVRTWESRNPPQADRFASSKGTL